jgi:mannonate dehydratase
MWANLEYWIKAITPVAEEEGIRLGIHPPDPPTDSHGGVFPVLNSYDGYRRLLNIVDSPANSIEFCQGTIAEMSDSADDAIYGFIDEMVRRDRILYVTFEMCRRRTPKNSTKSS